jgi:hypothetical protein
MTRSAQRRSNRYARKIASAITTDLSLATIAFTHVDAKKHAQEIGFSDAFSGFDAAMLQESNGSLLAELLNVRMPKCRQSKSRPFAPYADTFRPEYREPNHDPAHGKRTPIGRTERDFAEFAPVESR